MITIGQKVRVKNTDIIGIVTDIDHYYDQTIAVRIKIIQGQTAVTDYYSDELELID